jgi:hypothetical protein
MDSDGGALFFLLKVFLSGAGGWAFLNIVWKPWRDFQDLRRDIFSTMVYYADVHAHVARNSEVPAEDTEWGKLYREGRLRLRDLAGKLNAMHQFSFLWFHRCWAKARGYDIPRAAAHLIGMSNSRGEEHTSMKDTVNVALHFPREMTDKQHELHTNRLYGV